MRRFKPYPAYKDSGIEWLGDIPAHWDCLALARVSLSRCDGPFGSGLKSEHYSNVGVRVVRLQNIGWAEFLDTDRAYIDEAYARELGDHSIVAEDLLIAGLGDEGHPVGRACMAPSGIEPAMVKADCFRFRLDRRRLDARFAAYQLSATAAAVAGSFSIGATRSRMNLTTTAARKIALPPLDEQCATIAFPRLETKKIDALVAKKEKLIALLQEQRTALITRAVTRGLDPNAPMKDSGIEWLGAIPAHWEVKRIRDIANALQTGPFGSQLHADEYVIGGYPVINPANLRDGELVEDPDCTVDEATAYRLQHHRVQQGDILFARRGELGRCGLVGQRQEGWLCGTGCLRLRTRADVTKPCFLMRLLSTSGVADWLGLQSVGATMQNVNTAIIGRIPICLPPIHEQIKIANFLDGRTREIDRLVAKVRDAIGRLTELRTALISAAVTGKIDVRGEIA